VGILKVANGQHFVELVEAAECFTSKCNALFSSPGQFLYGIDNNRWRILERRGLLSDSIFVWCTLSSVSQDRWEMSEQKYPISSPVCGQDFINPYHSLVIWKPPRPGDFPDVCLEGFLFRPRSARCKSSNRSSGPFGSLLRLALDFR
jgi:hypothetical protein